MNYTDYYNLAFFLLIIAVVFLLFSGFLFIKFDVIYIIKLLKKSLLAIAVIFILFPLVSVRATDVELVVEDEISPMIFLYSKDVLYLSENHNNLYIEGLVTEDNLDKISVEYLSNEGEWHVFDSKDNGKESLSLYDNGSFILRGIKTQGSLSDGTYYLYATDQSGNVSNMKEVRVVKDFDSPVLGKISFNDSKVKRLLNNKFITKTFDGLSLSIPCKDVISGIDVERSSIYLNKIKYPINLLNDNLILDFKGDFSKNKSKINNIIFDIYDVAGNNTRENYELIIDDSKPALSVEFEEGLYFKDEKNIYFNANETGKDVKIKVFSEDDYCIKEIEVYVGDLLYKGVYKESKTHEFELLIPVKTKEKKVRIVVKDLTDETITKEFFLFKDESAPELPESKDIVVTDFTGNLKENNRFLSYFTGYDTVRVEAFNIKDDASGIKEVFFYCTVGGEVFLGPAKKENEGYFAIFNLPKNEKKTFGIIARDMLMQQSESSNDLFSIISNTSKPQIDVDILSDNYREYEGEVIFRDDLKLGISIKDEVALSSVKIYLGDRLIENEVDLYEDNKGKVNPVKNRTYEIDINEYINRGFKGELKIVCKNLGGYEEIFDKILFIKDRKAPDVGVIYADYMPIEKDSTNGFKHYSNKDMSITFSVVDKEDMGNIRDTLKEIKYTLFDTYGSHLKEGNCDKKSGNEYSFFVPKGFKGYVSIKARDVFNNTAIKQSGLILSEGEREYLNGFKLNLEGGSKEILNKAALVKIRVENEFAGIRDIKYSVISPHDTNNNYSGFVTCVNNKFTDNFKVEKSELNMVTSVVGSLYINNNSNDIKLVVEAFDNAGRTITKSMDLNIDKESPKAEIKFLSDNPTGFYNTERIGQIFIKERNFDKKGLNLNIKTTGKSIPRVSDFTLIKGENPDDDIYVGEIVFSEDGEYEIEGEFTDLGGNKCKLNPESFVIDKTPPQISILFDKALTGDKYINSKRSAIITVKEKNFDESLLYINMPLGKGRISSLESSYDEYRGLIEFLSDGEYEFSISCKDKAGNLSNTINSELFIVDLIKPEIEISGVLEYSNNKDEVVPVVTVRDLNINPDEFKVLVKRNGKDVSDLKINVTNKDNSVVAEFSDIPHEKNMDGIYEIIAEASDYSGNIMRKNLEFSVNRFGSTYRLFEDTKLLNNNYVAQPLEVGITEINVDKLNLSLINCVLGKNGNSYVLKKDKDYTVSKSNISYENSYDYVFSKDLFKEDGVYVLGLYSVDMAGNVNINNTEKKRCEISFGVDKTSPIAYCLNLETDSVINKPNLRVNALVKDNLFLKETRVSLNGKEIDFEKNDDILSFDVNRKDGPQSLSIKAIDGAGNSYLSEVNNFYVGEGKDKEENNYFVMEFLLMISCIILMLVFLIRRVPWQRVFLTTKK